MARKKRSTDDVFQIFRSMKAQYPISQFATSPRTVLDIQQIEAIESAYNREHKTNHDFQQFTVVNRIIRNCSEQGLVKTLNRRADLPALAGLYAADLKYQAAQLPSEKEFEEDYEEVAEEEDDDDVG